MREWLDCDSKFYNTKFKHQDTIRILLEETIDAMNVIEIGLKKIDELHMLCYNGDILEVFKVQPARRSVMDANDVTIPYNGHVGGYY